MTLAAGLTARELLEAAGAKHRAAVAGAIGLKDSSAEAIASALDGGDRLDAVVAELPDAAIACVSGAVFSGDAPILRRHRFAPGSEDPLVEVERRGLAFAFGEGWRRESWVPTDLVVPLRATLARSRAAAVADGDAVRFAAAPLQTAHDAAAVWAQLGREPVRTKANGEPYVRSWPKLYAALPRIAAHHDESFNGTRTSLALEFLRQGDLLRLRVDDRPGRDERRELVPNGDLRQALDVDPELLRERIVDIAAGHIHGVACAHGLASSLGDRVVALESFATALAKLADEHDPYAFAGHEENYLPAALMALAPLWLAGVVEFGLDADDQPVAVRLATPGQAPAEGPLAVCQSSFDVVLLRPPAPSERVGLELLCEQVDGQEHVYRVTRGSVRRARRDGMHPGGAAGALEELAGELPQNVRRSIDDWTRDVRAPLRLRTAMLVDAGDAETADLLCAGPLAGLVVERVGDRMLAIPGRRLSAVEKALAAAGHELDPGLDRISGTWREAPSRSGGASSFWAPADEDDEREPSGELVSTLGEAKVTASAPGLPTADLPSDGFLSYVLLALEEGRELDVRMLERVARGAG